MIHWDFLTLCQPAQQIPAPSRCQQAVQCRFQVGMAGQGSCASFASTSLHLH